MNIIIEPHPLLDAAIFRTNWPSTLGETPTLHDLDEWFSEAACPPLDRPEEIKPIIRDLLRHGGFKPSGRSKPASEYLVAAAAKGRMGGINAAVDCCNVASLHSGLPISVVDIDRGQGPWRIGLIPPNTEYIFNPAGQVISVGGLIGLFDESGPCGGPVKDSQRTKTHEKTRHTLSVVWGSTALPGRTEATGEWYTSLMESLGAQVERLRPTAP